MINSNKLIELIVNKVNNIYKKLTKLMTQVEISLLHYYKWESRAED